MKTQPRILALAALCAIGLSVATATVQAADLAPRQVDPYTDGGRLGKPDPYTDGAKSGKFDAYTDGAKQSTRSDLVNAKRDPYTDGGRAGKPDPFTDGARSVTDPRDPFS